MKVSGLVLAACLVSGCGPTSPPAPVVTRDAPAASIPKPEPPKEKPVPTPMPQPVPEPKPRSAPEPSKPVEVVTPSGLKYVDLVVGSGPSPCAGQKVQVHYTGWLTNGRKFDSSVDAGTPFEFRLGMGEVIPGWDEGVATMKVGGTRKLVIPSKLGYGARGAGGVIPPNATLVFEVRLLGIR